MQKLPPSPPPPTKIKAQNPLAIEGQMKLKKESKGGKFRERGTYGEAYVEILLSGINWINCQTWSSLWFRGLKAKFQVFSIETCNFEIWQTLYSCFRTKEQDNKKLHLPSKEGPYQDDTYIRQCYKNCFWNSSEALYLFYDENIFFVIVSPLISILYISLWLVHYHKFK